MQALNFPKYSLQVRQTGAITEVWDGIRKRWLVLTPEEWVRQHLIQYLIQEKKFPSGLMAIEKGLKVNGMSRRTDVVAYARHGSPLFLVECKAPEVKITQDTFDQAARYNMSLQVPYLMVSNGLTHYCCRIFIETQSYAFIEDVPLYDDL